MPEGSPNPAPGPRTAREVIDAAIREARVWEWVCLAITVGFAIAGGVLLIVGAVRGDVGLAGSGVGVAALYAPSLWAAGRFRERNIRIRLLEIPLGKARTAKEASDIMDTVFLRRPRERKSDASA